MRADKFARQKRHELMSGWMKDAGIKVCPVCAHPIRKTAVCSNCGFCLNNKGKGDDRTG